MKNLGSTMKFVSRLPSSESESVPSFSSFRVNSRGTATSLLSMKLRVFTENFFKNIPSFRFPLKIAASTLPHTSYTLPFYFDRARFMSYRVQAFAREVVLNREQGKHFIGYDLGAKGHVHLSSHSFVNLKRFSSFGTLVYGPATMIHFFRSLNRGAQLYLPFNKFQSGRSLKGLGFWLSPAWYVDPMVDVFKKRTHFVRRLRVQNDDLDLIISGSQAGLGNAFSQWPAPSTFCLLMPTYYQSFMISSYMQPRRLAFPYRFFRFFHKYFMRSNYWSFQLKSFWVHLNYGGPDNLPQLIPTFYNIISKRVSFFFYFKLALLFFKIAGRDLTNFLWYPLARFLCLSMYYSHSILLIIFLSIFLKVGAAEFKNIYKRKTNADIVYVQVHSNSFNDLFGLRNYSRKYLLINLGERLNVFCQQGYYRPGMQRFVFSLNGFGFLKVFPKVNCLTRPNAIAHSRLRKDIQKYSSNLFNPFGKLLDVVFKWWRKLLIVFLRNRASSSDFFKRLPLFLAHFFKFTRRLFGSAKPWVKTLFDNRRARKSFSTLFCRSTNKSLETTAAVFNSFSKSLGRKFLLLRRNPSRRGLARQSRKYNLLLLQKKYFHWGHFYFSFSTILPRLLGAAAVPNDFFALKWPSIYPCFTTAIYDALLWNGNLVFSRWSDALLAKLLIKNFLDVNLLTPYYPLAKFTQQLVNHFLNDLETGFWGSRVLKAKSMPRPLRPVFYSISKVLANSLPKVQRWTKIFLARFKIFSSLYSYLYDRLAIVNVRAGEHTFWGIYWVVFLESLKISQLFSLKTQPYSNSRLYSLEWFYANLYNKPLFLIKSAAVAHLVLIAKGANSLRRRLKAFGAKRYYRLALGMRKYNAATLEKHREKKRLLEDEAREMEKRRAKKKLDEENNKKIAATAGTSYEDSLKAVENYVLARNRGETKSYSQKGLQWLPPKKPAVQMGKRSSAVAGVLAQVAAKERKAKSKNKRNNANH